MYRWIPLLFAGALFACGGSQKGDASGPDNPCGANPRAANPCAANPCVANPCGGGGAATMEGGDFSGWQGWTKVNDAIFVSKGHSKKPADIYVKPDHAEWYQAIEEGDKAPAGFQVAKVHYEEMSGGEPTMLMVMSKMEAGYDPDNGDWFYAILDASGTRAKQAGKLDMCINCHASSVDTDFLGGLPQ